MKGKKRYLQKNKENKQQIRNQKKELLQKKGEEENKNNEKKKKDQEQEDKFRFKLLKKQYVLHVMKRDGNCLFSSISDQVYGTDKNNAIIREKCMDYIEKNKLFYSQFIEGGEVQMPAYIKRKRKNGIWGDNLEIQALSEIYNRPIEIYVDVDKPIRSFCNDGFDKKKFPIKISYHGNKHYNSIVPSLRHNDYILYKNELLNNNKPGTYEDNFIINYDISKKYNVKIDNINEPILSEIKDHSFDEDDYLYQDAIENSKKDINLNNINTINEENNGLKADEEYLANPIIQSALEFGFNLKDSIVALKVCGNNQELVLNYLLNDQQ